MTAARWDITVIEPKLIGVDLATLKNENTIVEGDTLQLEAYGVYSNGLKHLLPDTQGDRVRLWNTSNHAVARVSTLGRVTGVSPGVVSVAAYVGLLAATPIRIKILAAPPARSAYAASSMAPKGLAAPLAEDATADEAVVNTSSTLRTPATEEGNSSVSQSRGPVPKGPGLPKADSFAGPLWTLEAPAGGSASVSDGHLFVGVPGGGNHDPLSPHNDAVRVVQPIGDRNFTVSIKLDTPLLL